MGLIKRLNLKGHPFEHYTAETEPDIGEYAVRPPYLSSIIERSLSLNSFTLFGERGSGKSATRITVFSALWSNETGGHGEAHGPLAVSVTDFSQILDVYQKGKLTERDLVSLIAFHTLEKILAWLSSLSEEDRNIYIEGLNAEERSLAVALLEGFYLNIPEMDRQVTTSETLKLLNSAWVTKSQVWMNARWDAISKLFATALSTLSKRKIDPDLDISESTEKILKSLKSDAGNIPRAILIKLVELARAFGFSGICVLIDKVDETSATANSAEATARLVHPIFNHIQLMEIDGLSWIFFLWSSVKDHFSEKVPVRLDKIAHANITWTENGLREMIETRIEYFSDKRLHLSDLFDDTLDTDEVFSTLSTVAMSSPRELIKLFDIIVREHDIIEEEKSINEKSLNAGIDAYCIETVGSWYPKKLLNQVLRLGKTALGSGLIANK